MEQDNSLNISMQNLVNIQREQLTEIRELKNTAKLSSGSTMTSNPQGFGVPRDVKFTPYTMYSTTYDAPIGFSQGTYDRLNQAMFSGQQVNSGFKDLLFADNMRVNRQNRELMSMQAGNRVANAGVSLAGGVLSAGADLAAGAVMPGGLIAGLAGGAAAGAAVGFVFDNGLKNMKQFQRTNEYLFNNSYRFISRDESQNFRYGGGFSTDQRHEAAEFMRTINNDKFLKDAEVEKMLQQFTEYDLLKTVTDVKSFKEKTSKLIDTTKQAALTLKATYDEVTAMMGELNKVGVGSEGFTRLAAGANVVGQYTGKDSGQVFQTTSEIGTSRVANTDVNAEQEIQDVMMIYKALGQLSDKASKLKDTDPRYADIYNRLKNAGSLENYTASYMDKTDSLLLNNPLASGITANAFSLDSNGRLVVDYEGMEKTRAAMLAAQNGDYSKIMELDNLGKNKLQNNRSLFMALDNSQKRKNAILGLDEADKSLLGNSVFSFMTRGEGMNFSEIAYLMGWEIAEGDQEIMEEMFGTVNSDYKKTFESEQYVQEIKDKVQANKKGIFSGIKSGWGKFTDFISGNFVDFAQGWEKAVRNTDELINGINWGDYVSNGQWSYGDTKDMELVEQTLTKDLVSALKDLGYDKAGVNYGRGGTHSFDIEKFYSNAFDSKRAGRISSDSMIKDLESKIKETEAKMATMSPQERAAAKEDYDKLVAAREMIEQSQKRTIQSGADAIIAMSMFEGFAGAEDVTKSLDKLVAKQKGLVGSTAVDELYKMTDEQRKVMTDWLQGVDSKELTKYLNSKEHLKDFARISMTDTKANWSVTERETLINELMSFVNVGKTVDGDEADKQSGMAEKVKVTLEENNKLLEEIFKSEKETRRILQEHLYAPSSWNYYGITR